MKNKKLVFWFFTLTFLFIFLLVKPSLAAIEYKPNIPIPRTVNGYYFAETNIVSGDFLASYIVAIYQYGAGFAGIISMFMLVIAGWKWLMAAGYPQKIIEAKQMFSSVLLGLLLLFGGQLLLRQISEGFSSVQSLEITLSEELLQGISDRQAELEMCQAKKKGSDDLLIQKCKDYTKIENCTADVCNLVPDATAFNDHCVPHYKNDQFKECNDCPNNCSNCNFYKNAWIRKLDPCDCDRDNKGGTALPDPDGCCPAGEDCGL